MRASGKERVNANDYKKFLSIYSTPQNNTQAQGFESIYHMYICTHLPTQATTHPPTHLHSSHTHAHKYSFTDTHTHTHTHAYTHKHRCTQSLIHMHTHMQIERGSIPREVPFRLARVSALFASVDTADCSYIYTDIHTDMHITGIHVHIYRFTGGLERLGRLGKGMKKQTKQHRSKDRARGDR